MATATMTKISDDPRIQGFYEARIAEGLSPSLAEMFAFQQPPLPKDDTVWLTGMNELQKDMFEKVPDHVRRAYFADATAHGDNVSGAVYLPQLARYPGDREAFVRSQGEVRDRVEQRGWGADGAIKVTARTDVAPKPDIDIADDIVEEKVLDMVAANPELKVTPELIQEARDAIKPHWAK